MENDKCKECDRAPICIKCNKRLCSPDEDHDRHCTIVGHYNTCEGVVCISCKENNK